MTHPIILSYISICNLCTFPSINQFASKPIPSVRMTPINLCCHPPINPAEPNSYLPNFSIRRYIRYFPLLFYVCQLCLHHRHPPQKAPQRQSLPKASLPPTGDATSGPSTYTPALFYHTSASKRVHLRSSWTRETFSTHASLQFTPFPLCQIPPQSFHQSVSSRSPTNRFSLAQPAPAFFFVWLCQFCLSVRVCGRVIVWSCECVIVWVCECSIVWVLFVCVLMWAADQAHISFYFHLTFLPTHLCLQTHLCSLQICPKKMPHTHSIFLMLVCSPMLNYTERDTYFYSTVLFCLSPGRKPTSRTHTYTFPHFPFSTRPMTPLWHPCEI